LLLERNNEINIVNTAINIDERKNLENIKISKEKTSIINLTKYINEKENRKFESKDKKEIFLNNPDNPVENDWQKQMEKLGINQLKTKQIKKDEKTEYKNKFDDEFNQVFEISEKLTFKEEEINNQIAKKDEKNININIQAEKIISENRQEEKSIVNIVDKSSQNQNIIEIGKKEKPLINIDDVKKNKKIDKAIALEHLKAEESSKIVKEELLQNNENPEITKNNLIKINPIAKAEEKNNLNNIDTDLNELLGLKKNETKNEIEINPEKDEVELNKIDWDNQNFSQTSSNFSLSDALNMKRIEKNYQINHQIPDVSNVKSKIDTGIRRNRDNSNNFNKTGMTNNFFKKNDDNKGKLSNLDNNVNKLQGLENNEDQDALDYKKLEMENKNELKQFIQTVMVNKKEKRNNYFDLNSVIFNILI